MGIADYWIRRRSALAELAPAPSFPVLSLWPTRASTRAVTRTGRPPTASTTCAAPRPARAPAPLRAAKSCTDPPGESTPRSGLIGALEAYGVAAVPPNANPNRMPDPGVTVRQATCPYLHTPGWVPWNSRRRRSRRASTWRTAASSSRATSARSSRRSRRRRGAAVSAVGDNVRTGGRSSAPRRPATGASPRELSRFTMTKPRRPTAVVTFETLITDFFGSCPMSAPTNRDGKTGAPRAAARPASCSPFPPLAHASSLPPQTSTLGGSTTARRSRSRRRSRTVEPDPAMGPSDGPDAATVVHSDLRSCARSRSGARGRGGTELDTARSTGRRAPYGAAASATELDQAPYPIVGESFVPSTSRPARSA